MIITVTDWAFENCVATCNYVNGAIPWGYSIQCVDKDVAVYRHIRGNVIRETEKAINVEYTVSQFNHRCDLTGKTWSWRVWIPKSQIIAPNSVIRTFDGGKSQEVERITLNLIKNGYNVKKTWFGI